MDRLAANSVLPIIFSYLEPTKDLISARLVCRQFNQQIERNIRIMKKCPIHIDIENLDNVISIRGFMFKKIAWEAKISNKWIFGKEVPNEKPGIAHFISRKRCENLPKFLATSEEDGITCNFFGFDIATCLEGIKEIVDVIKETFSPTSLELTGNPMMDDRFCLIFPLLKNIPISKLDIGEIKSEHVVEILKSTVFSKIRVETNEGEGSLLHQLNTFMYDIIEKRYDVPFETLERALKEWPDFNLNEEQLQNLMNDLKKSSIQITKELWGEEEYDFSDDEMEDSDSED